ncbi:MAG: C39 family peptidase [Ruminococcus sp.]|nr:C39 family peptidase [Ruminococcus sp.]
MGITFDSGGGYISIPSTYTDINYGIKKLTSTILSSIYKELKKGHPVIISRCNSSGNQHFVVIKGYTGDGISYSANQLVVNDPGSSKTPVTTLDQIFTSGYGVRHIIYRD